MEGKNIVRVQKNRDYTVINNTSIRDTRLSWKAKAIHVFMLSKPDDWTFYNEEMQQWAKDGKDSFTAGLRELQKYGYVKKERRRVEGGKFDYVTIVYEVPYMDLPHTEKPSSVEPYTGKPLTEKPSTDKPFTENPQLLSTDIPSTDSLNTDNNQVLTTDTKHAQRLYEFFVSRLQKFPSDKLREDIEYYLSTYHDADLIIEAFERALINSRVTNKEKYATGTLRNWKHEGVTSIELLAKKEAQQLASNQRSIPTDDARKSEIRAENERRAKLAGL